ncbi:hypothetical protein FRX31_010530 [Thalictrum thalictroides]|uniref:RNase H type-1 domain-containing protein n=1 Tax=Thalictrum thalictroides TaxID=46969 RepID=A0A7J6WTS9_THATH|nr:hypothetical protein FRX31_010530 [Thalictrum thalictroides]
MQQQIIGWKVADGNEINIWNDSWIPNVESNVVREYAVNFDQSTNAYNQVSQLIDDNTRQWRWDLICNIWRRDFALKVYSTHISRSALKDKMVWKWSSNEFLAVLIGVKLLTRLTSRRIIIETESQVVHKALTNADNETHWELQNLKAEIKEC